MGPVSYRAQISITNTVEEPLAVDSLQLGPEMDGTPREGRPAARFSIIPKKTFVLRPARARAGCWSSTLPPASLQRPAGRHRAGAGGVELPVITPDNMGRPNERLVVQGLEGSGRGSPTSSSQPRRRLVELLASVVRADGTWPSPGALSLRPFRPRPRQHLQRRLRRHRRRARGSHLHEQLLRLRPDDRHRDRRVRRSPGRPSRATPP